MRPLAYFLDLAKQAEPQMWRDQEIAWLQRLETEHDNLRAALEWSLSAQSSFGVAGGLKAVLALDQFWRFYGHYNEAMTLLDSLLSRPEASEQPDLLADGLRLSASYEVWWSGIREETGRKFGQSLAMAVEGLERVVAYALEGS